MKLSRPFLLNWLYAWQEMTGILLDETTDDSLVDYMLREIEKTNPEQETINDTIVYETNLTPEFLLTTWLNQQVKLNAHLLGIKSLLV